VRLLLSLGVALVMSAGVVAAETAIGWMVLDHRLADIVMLYLLGVVMTAMRFGYAPSLMAAALSVAAFDFFFTAPYFSLAVYDKRSLVTFAIMFLVAFVISNRTEWIRRNALDASRRETRTATLYAMSRELAVAPSSEDIMRVAYRHLRDVFASEVCVLLPNGDGGLRAAGTTEAPLDLEVDAEAAARAMLVDGAPATWERPPALPHGPRLVSLRASTGTVGVLAVRPTSPDYFSNDATRTLLDTFASQIALAIERARLAEDAQRAQVEVQNERLRNALLSSVSHDLRTPLAVVKGAVTALLDGDEKLPPTRRREYLETISDEASRLNRLVRNLLDMTRLEAGALRVRTEWLPLEEVIGVALNRLDDQLQKRPITVRIPADASLVPFDATLLEQVFINLVENAIKYTPSGSPIEIGARRVEGGVEVEVADTGPGVPAGEEEAIFEKFHRAARTAAGMGIGLTICRGIITAHGGRIWCENRANGGASFRFVLPRVGEAPPMSILPEAVGDP
jgi:two-component system, OmpR family, sensor histidine kinase KdpD